MSSAKDDQGTPKISFAVPGDWFTVSLTDQDQLASFAKVVNKYGGDGEQAVRELVRFRESGGFGAHFRVGVPTALLFSWPEADEGTDYREMVSLHSLVPKKVEDTVEVVTSRDGYPALRHAFHQADNDIPGATYWVTHPDSARLLRIDVLQFDTTDLAADLEIYDTLVYMLHWEDSPDE